jgi:molecular chaperone HtpG
MRQAVSQSKFTAAPDEHYTEVEMDALTSVGLEFIEPGKLHPYLSQVCPVAYGDKFDYSDRVGALAASCGDDLGVVQIETRVKRERFPIHKPYKNEAAAGKRGPAKLHGIQTFISKENGWYGWIGLSQFPGEITDDTVAGVRFRMKNIQVGDALIMMDLAEQLTETGSERRLPRWTVGEIFVTNPEIVPNARRDGFEDTPAWRSASTEIRDTVADRIVKLVRNASSSRSAIKSAFAFLDEVKAKLEGPPLEAAVKKKHERKLKSLIDKFSNGRLVGPDPKEVSSLISALKDLQERLARAPVAEPAEPPTTTSPPPGTNPGAQGGPGTSSEPEPEEAGEPDVLDVVYGVLAEELGDEEAERLMDIIAARLRGE